MKALALSFAVAVGGCIVAFVGLATIIAIYGAVLGVIGFAAYSVFHMLAGALGL